MSVILNGSKDIFSHLIFYRSLPPRNRLNVQKYSARPNVAKALFEYIYYHENAVREALDLGAQVGGQRRSKR